MKTKSAEEWLTYLHDQFPATVGHKPLEDMFQQVREEALREAAEVAELSLERKDVRWEYATNVSTVPRDAILSLISR